MKNGQSPDPHFFFRWLARLREGADYQLSQTINPVVDVSEYWPKEPVLRRVVASEAAGVLDAELWGTADWTLTNAASPSHGMCHRISLEHNFTVATEVRLFLSHNATLARLLMVERIVTGAAGATVEKFDCSNLYLPTGWVLFIGVVAPAVGDGLDIKMEYSTGPQEKPLPRDI